MRLVPLLSKERLGEVKGGRLTEIFNKSSSKQTRRNLRRNSPKTESILWSRIRNRQINGFKFKRQFGFGRYIVDFYCSAKKLIIEIDGESHFNDKAIEYDNERELYLKSLGLKIVRFTNRDITNNLQGALLQLMGELKK